MKAGLVGALFRHGYDTLYIADRLNIPEHEVLKLLTQERSIRKRLPDPYARNVVELSEFRLAM